MTVKEINVFVGRIIDLVNNYNYGESVKPCETYIFYNK